MNRTSKILCVTVIAALAAWSLAVAGMDEQKKILEVRVATVTVQVDEHEARVKAMARWPHIKSPTPSVAYYDLKEKLNALKIEMALCVTSLVLDYGAKGVPTMAIPTVMPTRTPVPKPTATATPKSK
jgi:hypothetical protein